jgi:hypothetical protein
MATLEIDTHYKPSADTVYLPPGDRSLTIVVPPGGCEIRIETIHGCPEFSVDLKDDIIIDFGKFPEMTLHYKIHPYGTRRKGEDRSAAHSIQIGN